MERQIRKNRRFTFFLGVAVMIVLPVTEAPDVRDPVLLDKSVQIEETIVKGSVVYDINDENSKSDMDADGNHLLYLIVGQNTTSPFAIDENTGEIRTTDTVYLNSDSYKSFQIVVYANNGTGSDDALITISIGKP